MKLKIQKIKYATETHTCQNCKHIYTGAVCNMCGEKVFHTHQLSSKHFLHEVIDFFYHFESKVLKTIKLNFLKPGFITKENLMGIRIPYAKPVQLYLVVSLLFYLVVSKIKVSDYIPAYGDHYYYGLSSYPLFKWAEPIDNKVISSIDTAYNRKQRKVYSSLMNSYYSEPDANGSYKIYAKGYKDSTYIPASQIKIVAFNEARKITAVAFKDKVGTYGKTLIFLLLPFIAFLFFVLFYRKIKYYGAALILATHFMIYNLCIYMLHAIMNWGPARLFGDDFYGWMTKPFLAVFYNSYTETVSRAVINDEFEFIHFLFWMPWLIIAFKRLFETPWWKNILAAYFCSKVFYYLIYGVLKKVVIAATIWSM